MSNRLHKNDSILNHYSRKCARLKINTLKFRIFPQLKKPFLNINSPYISYLLYEIKYYICLFDQNWPAPILNGILHRSNCRCYHSNDLFYRVQGGRGGVLWVPSNGLSWKFQTWKLVFWIQNNLLLLLWIMKVKLRIRQFQFYIPVRIIYWMTLVHTYFKLKGVSCPIVILGKGLPTIDFHET